MAVSAGEQPHERVAPHAGVPQGVRPRRHQPSGNLDGPSPGGGVGGRVVGHGATVAAVSAVSAVGDSARVDRFGHGGDILRPRVRVDAGVHPRIHGGA